MTVRRFIRSPERFAADLDIVAAAVRRGYDTRRELCARTGITNTHLEATLAALVASGRIERVGNGGYITYRVPRGSECT
jgi:predicted transcriptional regulator of viral defense system